LKFFKFEMTKVRCWCSQAISTALAYVEEIPVEKNTCVEAVATKCLNGRDPSHDLYHAMRVRDLAMKICHFETIADTDMIETAALLHDVLDHKYIESAEANRPELEAFLTKHGGLHVVMNIIDTVSYSKEKKSREANTIPPFAHLDEPVLTYRHIVSDADKIDALGPIGLKRCIQYTLESQSNHNPELVVQKVLLHLQEKLLTLLPDYYIRTSGGRALAKEGHEFLQCWYDEALNNLTSSSSNATMFEGEILRSQNLNISK